MARYGKIETGFWHSPKVRQLSERARFLLLYLFSCPHGNAIGCFVIHDGYIAADMDWPIETVSQTLSELFEKGLIERDETTLLLRIVGWWGHNTVENANVAKHVVKEIASLPNCKIKHKLVADTLAIDGLHETVRQTLSKGLRKPFRNQEPNLTQPEPNLHTVADATADDEFEKFKSEYPSRGDAANPWKPARDKFARAIKRGVDPAKIISGAKIYRQRCERSGINKTEKVAQAITWLNQERWRDYTGTATPEKQIDWDRHVREFRETSGARWPWKIAGPDPGSSGCRAPPGILAKYGFDVSHATTAA